MVLIKVLETEFGKLRALIEINMLELKVKKAILETKEKKEKLLIEQTLIKKRILMIFESEKNIKNFDSLPKFKKEKIAYKLVSEINFLVETNLLNEQLKDFLGKIFGDNLTGVFQSNQLGSNPSRKKLMSMRQFIKSRASLVSVWITLVIMLLSITMP